MFSYITYSLYLIKTPAMYFDFDLNDQTMFSMEIAIFFLFICIYIIIFTIFVSLPIFHL